MHGVREVSWGFGKRDFLQEKRDIQGKKKKFFLLGSSPVRMGMGRRAAVL